MYQESLDTNTVNPDSDAIRYRTRYLPALQLQPGMVIGRAVSVTIRGRLVLQIPEGTTLDAQTVQQLVQRGAEHACILEPDTRSEQQRQAQRAHIRKRLEKIFAVADLESDATRCLFDAVLEYRSL